MKRFSHWVFDLDGTLIDSSGHYEESIVEILAEFQIRPSAEDLERAYRFFNPEDYFGTFFTDPDKIATAVRRLVEMNIESAGKIPAFAGIEEILMRLKSRGVQISAWTGRELNSATKVLHCTGLMKYFSVCVGRTCVAKNKPHPDGLLKILSEFKLKYSDVVMVGDHEYDIQGARAANVTGISVNWDRRAQPAARSLADCHFDRVAELSKFVQDLYD